MRKLISCTLVFPCLLAAGCASVDTGLRNTVVLHYQHVANVYRIDFSNPVTLRRPRTPVHFVLPLESQGFWAVFLLCSLDATGADIPSFYLDVERFRVQFDDKRYGPLRPYTLRLDESVDLNTRPDTPALARAVADEIAIGPPRQLFRHGYYPDLNYRFAIYIPHGLPDYSGDQLTLRYEGGKTMVLGNGVPPSRITTAGADGMGITSHCLP